MSKVIDNEDRLKLEQKKKRQVEKTKKREAVRKILQCTRCLARCLKCGVQFDTQDMYKRYPGPFRLCSGCQEEYDEFVRLQESKGDSPYFWHNKEWRQVNPDLSGGPQQPLKFSDRLAHLTGLYNLSGKSLKQY